MDQVTYPLVTFQVIQTYLKATAGSYRKPQILNVWEVDRETEVREVQFFLWS